MICPFLPFFLWFLFVCVRRFLKVLFFSYDNFPYPGSHRYSEDETDRSAYSGSADFVMKTDNCPFPKSGWATTTATTEEFSQSIQAPSSTHPGISYPVRANPSVRYIYIYAH